MSTQQQGAVRDDVDPPPAWPTELGEVFERAITCEYASLTRAGRPVTVPSTPYVGSGTLDVSTGLTYPAKAERARRNPKVALLFADAIGKSFRGRKVVSNVSLRLARGEVAGLLGPNGAGKTTCFYMITGLIAVDYGNIWLDGENITAQPMYQRARMGVGYLPQEASIFRGMTVEENIMAVVEMREPSDKRARLAVTELLEELRIGHVRKSLGIALSGGERRRVEIARALAAEPRFMLLDEPFAGVDPLSVLDIQRIIRELTHRGIGVLITDHNVRETLGVCSRAYIVNQGTVIAAGTAEEVLANPQVREVYLGEAFKL